MMFESIVLWFIFRNKLSLNFITHQKRPILQEITIKAHLTTILHPKFWVSRGLHPHRNFWSIFLFLFTTSTIIHAYGIPILLIKSYCTYMRSLKPGHKDPKVPSPIIIADHSSMLQHPVSPWVGRERKFNARDLTNLFERPMNTRWMNIPIHNSFAFGTQPLFARLLLNVVATW